MNLKFHKGGVVGIIASISQFNIALLGPIHLIISVAMLPIRRPPSRYQILLSLIALKILSMTTIQLFWGQMSLVQNMVFMLGDIILLALIFLRGRRSDVIAYLKSVYFLFVVDLVFNLSIKLLGADPFGRGASIRPGDTISRVGGLFDHPFVSTQIAVIGIICGIALEKRWMVILASIGLLINGTLRSPLSLILILALYLVIRLKPRFWVFVSVSVVFSATVFLLTIYTASDLQYTNGNFYRVFAWNNAITKIIENPIIGFHDFKQGSFDGISFEVITDFGIAESYYLDLWLRYGFFAPVISLSVFLIILKRAVQQNVATPQDPLLKAKLMMAAFTFCDTFYGNFFGTVLTTTTYAVLCTCYEPNRKRLSTQPA